MKIMNRAKNFIRQWYCTQKSIFLVSVAIIGILFLTFPALALSPAWTVDLHPDPHAFSADRSLALSADGSGLVLLNGSDILKIDTNGTTLWNTTEDRTLRNLAMSENGTNIAAASWNREVLYFDGNGHEIWRRNEVLGNILALSLSGNGQFIVSGVMGAGPEDFGGNVSLFDKNGMLLWNYPTPAPIVSTAISETGDFIVAGGDGYDLYESPRDPDVYFFDGTGRLIWSERTLGGNSVAMDSAARYIAVGTRVKNIISLYTRDGIRLWTYQASSDVVSVSVSPDGELIYAIIGPVNSHVTPEDSTVICLNRNGTPSWTYSLDNPTDVFTVLRLANQSPTVIAGSQLGNIVLLGTRGEVLGKYKANDTIEDIVLSDDGRTAAARTQDTLYFFSSAANRTVPDSSVSHTDNTSVVVSPLPTAQPVSSNASPPYVIFILFALCCIGGIVIIGKR